MICRRLPYPAKRNVPYSSNSQISSSLLGVVESQVKSSFFGVTALAGALACKRRICPAKVLYVQVISLFSLKTCQMARTDQPLPSSNKISLDLTSISLRIWARFPGLVSLPYFAFNRLARFFIFGHCDPCNWPLFGVEYGRCCTVSGVFGYV